MEERYIACLVLQSLGDTIGFKNGEWEFKNFSKNVPLDYTNEILYEFIDLGGINHLDVKKWNASDDTIMHMRTAEALLENFNSLNTFANILKEKYIEAFKQLKEEKNRYPGVALMKYLKELSDGTEWDAIPYDFKAGGSGASMRTSCIGLAYHGINNREKLIQISIEASRITHNSAVGYLGGMTSALFTAFAIEDLEINLWPFELLKIFENNLVENYIKKTGRGVSEYDKDSHIFINKWKTYIDDKFDENKKPIKRKTTRNLVFRGKYYYDNYSFKQEGVFFPGSGGDDSVIIAFDCLLDAGNSWEKLVIYSMMHIGDTDTTGSIAASWWGALKGFQDVPPINYENLEYKNKLIKLGKELYEKYYKKQQ